MIVFIIFLDDTLTARSSHTTPMGSTQRSSIVKHGTNQRHDVAFRRARGNHRRRPDDKGEATHQKQWTG